MAGSLPAGAIVLCGGAGAHAAHRAIEAYGAVVADLSGTRATLRLRLAAGAPGAEPAWRTPTSPPFRRNTPVPAAPIRCWVNALLSLSHGRDERGLVICTDVARYDAGTSAEITQGAGAVAMIAERGCGLVELELGRRRLRLARRG